MLANQNCAPPGFGRIFISSFFSPPSLSYLFFFYSIDEDDVKRALGVIGEEIEKCHLSVVKQRDAFFPYSYMRSIRMELLIPWLRYPFFRKLHARHSHFDSFDSILLASHYLVMCNRLFSSSSICLLLLCGHNMITILSRILSIEKWLT